MTDKFGDKRIPWEQIQTYLRDLDVHYKSVTSFMNLVEAGNLTKPLVE